MNAKLAWALSVFSVASMGLAHLTHAASTPKHPVAIESIPDLRERIESSAHLHFAQQIPEHHLASLEVRASNLDARLRLPRCTSDTRIQAMSATQANIQTSFRVECLTPRWSLVVPVKADYLVDVVLAAQALPRGHILRAEDLTLSQRPVSQVGYGNLESPQKLVGQQLKRAVSLGQALRATTLTAPQAIKRGDIVQLSAEHGSLAVVTEATALSSGAIGERVRLRNERSKRIVDATITAPGAATIRYGRP